MKYILDEKANVRFLLSEGRFVLTEADEKTLETAKNKFIESISKYDDELFNKLTDLIVGKKEQAIDFSEIDAAKLAADSQFNQNKDTAILKSKVTEYTDALQKYLLQEKNGNGNALSKYKNISKAIDKLKKLSEKTPTKELEIEKFVKELQTQYGNLSTLVDAVKTEQTDKQNAPDSNQIYIDNAKEAIEKTLNAVKDKVKTPDDNIIKQLNEASEILEDALTGINEQLTKDLSDDIDRKTASDYAIINLNKTTKACNGILEALGVPQEEAEKEAKENATKAADWDTRFKEAGKAGDEKAIAALWDEYYRSAWGNDAEKIKGLGTPFIQEVTKLGFTEDRNPFISFLKNNINKLNINSKTYAPIHNAYARGWISSQDLRNNSSDILLYNPALYSFDSRTIFEYLDIFKNSIQNISNEKATAAGYDTSDALKCALLADNVDVANKQKSSAANIASVTPLRRLDDIRKILNNVLGIKSEKSKDTLKVPAELNTIIRNVNRRGSIDGFISYMIVSNYDSSGIKEKIRSGELKNPNVQPKLEEIVNYTAIAKETDFTKYKGGLAGLLIDLQKSQASK